MRGDTDDGTAPAAPDTRPIALPIDLPIGLPAPHTLPTGIAQPTVISLPAQGRGPRAAPGGVTTPAPSSAPAWGLPLGAAMHPQPRPTSPHGPGRALLPDPPRHWGSDSSPAVQHLASPRWLPPARGSGPVPVPARVHPAVEWVDGAAEPRFRFGFAPEELSYLGAPMPQDDGADGRRRAAVRRRGEPASAADLDRPVRGRSERLAMAAVVTAVAIVCGTASLLVSRPDPTPSPTRTGDLPASPAAGVADAAGAAPTGRPTAGQPELPWVDRGRVAQDGVAGGTGPTAAPVAAGAVRVGGSFRGGAAASARGGARESVPSLPGASAIAVYPVVPDLPASSSATGRGGPTPVMGASKSAVPIDPVPIDPVSTIPPTASAAPTAADPPTSSPGQADHSTGPVLPRSSAG